MRDVTNKMAGIAGRLAVSALVVGMLAAGSAGTAMAQAGSMLPIPFSSTYAGLPHGGTATTPCTPDIPDTANFHKGDGCLPSQAVIGFTYDAEVDTLGNVYISENGTFSSNQTILQGTTPVTGGTIDYVRGEKPGKLSVCHFDSYFDLSL